MNEEQVTQTATEAPVTQPQESAKEGVELNISDLQSLKAIVDIASQRGAFKASEMAAVGNTYNRLSKFLDEVAKGQ
jgi:hypothetical protein